MRAAVTRSSRVATLAFLGIMGVTLASAQGSSCPASPGYSPDFSMNQSCLTSNGTNSGYSGSPSFAPPATPESSVSTVLRLTANQGGWATSAWYQTPQAVSNGFSTTFAFQLGSTTSYDADGFAFVIQSSGLSALAPGGCGIGFGGSCSGCATGTGIGNSIAIEFNTYITGAG